MWSYSFAIGSLSPTSLYQKPFVITGYNETFQIIGIVSVNNVILLALLELFASTIVFVNILFARWPLSFSVLVLILLSRFGV